jgi:DNA polymerase I-like protein with 3'-5' exonuclease and polymerase domains
MRHLVSTKHDLTDVVDLLKSESRLAHDTETKGPQDVGGLWPFHGSRSFSHIIGNEKDQYYFDFNIGGINPKYKSLLQPIFDEKERVIFYVNAIFDGCISHFDGITFHQRIVDCPSIARVEYNRHDPSNKTFSTQDDESFLSLEYLANYYNVETKKNDLVKKYIEENNLYSSERCRFTGKKIPLYERVPIDLMFEYGCDDVKATYELGSKILKCINYKDKLYQAEANGTKMINVAKNEVKLTSVLLDMKIKGMRLWPEYVEEAIEREQKIFEDHEKELNQLTGGINTNSGKQLAELLISHGVQVPRKEPTKNDYMQADKWREKRVILENKLSKETKEKTITSLNKKIAEAKEKIDSYESGRYKTDKKTLAKIIEKNPDLAPLKLITSKKESEKKLNTYYRNFLKLQDKDNFVHCGLNQEKAITGRFSSDNPNLQNLEKHHVELDSNELCIRKSFIADEGCRLFFADYSQQEMVYMLDQAGEMLVIKKMVNGEVKDFYLATAGVLKDVLNIMIERKQAKDTSLALAYGKGNRALAVDFGYITPTSTIQEEEDAIEETKKFKTQFFKALPKLKLMIDRLARSVKRYGKVHNHFGRVTYLENDESYKALNSICQGGAADITKRAMVLWAEKSEGKDIGKSRLTLCVHDELIFNVEIGKEEIVLPIIEQAMVEAYEHNHIPLAVDFEFSTINKHGFSSWGEKIDYKEGM